ncbi:penicillin-binding protein [Sphaerisporangium siamense]|uniref:Membrane peptidoglycan carboxypeptidase n=1 Tax=Sphaerisporangium siamense TaxID=795645 RepID=A0A7W7G827_9ACTN|nr:transglycosylase domain-containing protein [Sphaerisporangium siamense]MBB4699085.1 membrane peptidoglycan carboxypeptidase [Sphaerisporangium siamense]GII86788.1 penicillin-binding protein [Sphaerisporangium siamense]
MFGNLLRLLGAAVAAGVLAAAIALPAVGGAGMGVKSTTDVLNLKPEDLEEPLLPEKTVIRDASGAKLAQFYYQNRESVKLDKVAPIMRQAIIAIEDFRFYEHGALDLEGSVRALMKNFQSGGVAQGGSSITQQYVKQVIFNKAETEEEKAAAIAPTVSRKLNELRYAMAVEQQNTKDQILEKYLNIAYFGASSYGIQAASKRFFDKPASELNLEEAATLAGAVQNPNATDPNLGKQQRAALLARRNVVLDRMAELGKITTQQAIEAKTKKLTYKDIAIPGGCEQSKYPYFCLYVQHEILNDPQFGKTEKARREFLNRGGLVIRTTLDTKMQKAAEKAIKKFVHASDKPVAAEALIEPGTGAIKAMAASRKFGGSKKKNESNYNLVADVAHGGGTGFQAGSTFKAFTLATALKEGMRYDDGINSGSSYQAGGYSDFKNCKGENVGDPSHVAHNSEGGGGFKTLRTGTWGSVNTFFLRLEQKVGLCDVVKTAKDLGIKRADGRKLSEVETFTLGVNEMDPVTVAAAYATFASRGSYCKPMAITSITDRTGKKTQFKPDCKQALDEKVADAVSGILSGVFTKGTMSGVGGIGRDAAGKTGTTDGSMTAWFAGYTPDLAGAVSLGDPRGSYTHPLRNIRIGGRYYGEVFGATISGRIWKETFLKALKGIEASSFTSPDMSQFGGCSGACAPKPPRKTHGEDGGPFEVPNGNDGGGDIPNIPDIPTGGGGTGIYPVTPGIARD